MLFEIDSLVMHKVTRVRYIIVGYAIREEDCQASYNYVVESGEGPVWNRIASQMEERFVQC